MADSVLILAGEALKALHGHRVQVGAETVAVGQDGKTWVTPENSRRLLAQAGWAAYDLPRLPVTPLGGGAGDHLRRPNLPSRRRGRPRKFGP